MGKLKGDRKLDDRNREHKKVDDTKNGGHEVDDRKHGGAQAGGDDEVDVREGTWTWTMSE